MVDNLVMDRYVEESSLKMNEKASNISELIDKILWNEA